MNLSDGMMTLSCPVRIKICTKSVVVQKMCIFFNQPAVEKKSTCSSMACGDHLLIKASFPATGGHVLRGKVYGCLWGDGVQKMGLMHRRWPGRQDYGPAMIGAGCRRVSGRVKMCKQRFHDALLRQVNAARRSTG